jgi:hypothetical protein
VARQAEHSLISPVERRYGVVSAARRRTRAAWVAAALALVIAAVPAASGAYVSSGWIYKGTFPAGPYGHVRGCLEAAVDADLSVVHYGSIGSFDTSGTFCSGTTTLGTGYLGVSIYGYQNGAFCGFEGYSYNQSPTWYWSEAGAFCVNQPGIQSYATTSYGRISNGSGGYHNLAGVTSPPEGS